LQRCPISSTENDKKVHPSITEEGMSDPTTRREQLSRATEHADGASDKPTVFQVALIRSLAGFCGGLAVLSIFWPDWIEALTGYDPDQHDGTVEWLIVLALLSFAPYWRSRRGRARRLTF
jgi:hypothetical protein